MFSALWGTGLKADGLALGDCVVLGGTGLKAELRCVEESGVKATEEQLFLVVKDLFSSHTAFGLLLLREMWEDASLRPLLTTVSESFTLTWETGTKLDLPLCSWFGMEVSELLNVGTGLCIGLQRREVEELAAVSGVGRRAWSGKFCSKGDLFNVVERTGVLR